MTNYIGQNVMMTCSEWFYGPDCQSYKVVWGKLKSIVNVSEHLGFQPNRPNANWVYEIGNMIIYGCQVKYIVLCPEKPDTTTRIQSWTTHPEKGIVEYEAPNSVYITE